MITRVPAVLLFCCIAVLPATARAQERGQAGVVMGYPTTFAFIWHASDRLAIRPEVSFVHTSSESENSILGDVFRSSSNDSWNATVGASALWYFRGADRVRPYFSPRVAFAHNSSDSSTNDEDPQTSNTLSASGSFGAQYTPVRKLAVYGELGYGFSRGWSEFRSQIATSKNTGWAWSPRGAVGVIFYFGRS